VGPVRETLAFYSVAAQVIAVLFLALAFEANAFGRLDRPAEKDFLLAAIRLYAFFLIVWGEARALGVLSAQAGSATAHGAVVAALITEAILLALEPALAFLRAGVSQASPRVQRYLEVALRGLLIATGITLIAIGAVLLVRGL
jgi:hypothetical protein